MTERILQPTDENIERCARHLIEGGLVGIPTETVYGLAANAADDEAVAAIYTAKSRPTTNPLIVHVANTEQAEPFVDDWNDDCKRLAEAFWPGPLTLVLGRSQQVSDLVTAGHETVAVRSPAHDVARRLIECADRALVAPSANQSGQVSATDARHVISEFPLENFPVLDGGACALGIESTVLDLTGEMPLVLRPGAVTLRALRNVLPDVQVPVIGEQTNSPGTALRHYAPRTPTVLVESERFDERIDELDEGVAVISIGPRRLGSQHVLVQMPEAADDYARRLYAGLREADESGCGLIVVEVPPSSGGLWRAINDRLQRACVPPLSP
jgi:L-threonylcarbamoyladenylate synthase